MKFIVDAQLPRRLAIWLTTLGHDAIHTLDLPNQNRTSDKEIIELAEQEERVVITKDVDFVDSHLLHKKPGRLVLISTGNMTNKHLELLFHPLIPEIVQELQSSSFLEVTSQGLQIRG